MTQSTSLWRNQLNSANRNFDVFNKRVDKSSDYVRTLGTELSSLTYYAANAFGVSSIIKYSDTWKLLSGRLSVVEGEMSRVVRVQDRLFSIAQNSRQSLEGITKLYTKINMALTDNQRKMYDVAGVTSTFAKALAITGETAASAEGAILQFSQALASDFKSSGQELNSILEQAPRVAKAIAEVYNTTPAGLKKLVQNGEVTTDKVLRTLEPTSRAAKAIAKEFEKIPTTVGQAITQLDNAFLQFIGRSDAVQKGTSALSLGIKELADNIGVVSTLVGVVAVRQLSRFVTTMAMQRVEAVMFAREMSNVNKVIGFGFVNALARSATSLKADPYTGVKSSANGAMMSMMALNSAIRTVNFPMSKLQTFTSLVGKLGSGILALAGGPVGALILGLTYLATRQTEAQEAAEEHRKTLAKLDEVMGYTEESVKNMSDAQKQLAESTLTTAIARETEAVALAAETIKDYVDNYRETLDVSEELYLSVRDQENAFLNLAKSYQTGQITLSDYLKELRQMKTTVEEDSPVAKMIDEVFKLIGGFEDAKTRLGQLTNQFLFLTTGKLPEADAPVATPNSGGGGGGSSKRDEYKDIIRDLEKQNDEVRTRVDLFGEEEAAVDKAIKKLEIRNRLSEAGVKLNDKQQEQLDLLLNNLEQQEKALGDLEKAKKDDEEADKRRKDALEELSMTFESSFEDAILSGEKLSDVMQNLLNDILKLLIRAQITGPIFRSILDSGSGSGGGGLFGFIGDIFSGGMPSFGTGTAYVPKDMVARIHKGERIVPAHQNDNMMGGSPMVVNVINNNGSKVSTNSKNTPQGTQLDVMIDELVAEKMTKPGTKTNQALKSYNSRTLTRR